MQAMIDRDGDGAEVGCRLLWQSDRLFESWHKARDGTIQRSTFLQTVAWLRPMVRTTLERGAVCACPKTAATCAELLRLWDCLWTFTRVEGVEPTNNAAERALRHAVIWRRVSGGTDSETGSRYMERMLDGSGHLPQAGQRAARLPHRLLSVPSQRRPVPIAAGLSTAPAAVMTSYRFASTPRS